MTMNVTAADPGFPRREAPTPEFDAETKYLARFCRKPHENERNWIRQ